MPWCQISCKLCLFGQRLNSVEQSIACLLRVSQQHGGVLVEEHWIVDSCIALGQGAFHDDGLKIEHFIKEKDFNDYSGNFTSYILFKNFETYFIYAEKKITCPKDADSILYFFLVLWRKSVNLTNRTCLAFQTLSTGIPAIDEFGSSSAAELTVSFAPITKTKSVSGNCKNSNNPLKPRKLVYFIIDLVHFIDNIVGHTSLCQQHVQLTRHSSWKFPIFYLVTKIRNSAITK